jgi:hypothetical protein
MKDVIEIKFHATFFKKGDILNTGDTMRYKVLNRPRTRWYHKVLWVVSFGCYWIGSNYRLEILR